MPVCVTYTEKTAQMELDRAEREIEQLKVDHEIAIEKREKQVRYPNFFLCCVN